MATTPGRIPTDLSDARTTLMGGITSLEIKDKGNHLLTADEKGNLRNSAEYLTEALDEAHDRLEAILGWFMSGDQNPRVFASTELLLCGCPNELWAEIQKGRKLLKGTK